MYQTNENVTFTTLNCKNIFMFNLLFLYSLLNDLLSTMFLFECQHNVIIYIIILI